jgi:hypothetical protein
MSYLKITAVILLILFVLWGSFYVWVIQALITLVSESNEGFIAYLPTEAIAVILLIVFAILIWLAYSFFRE